MDWKNLTATPLPRLGREGRSLIVVCALLGLALGVRSLRESSQEEASREQEEREEELPSRNPWTRSRQC